ncbi:MAG: MaoC family dehydratase [Bosea sp. (in: a-proteobacteria)]
MSGQTAAKTSAGRFFEDFRLGEVIRHATPRTVTAGDVSLNTALFGSRFAVQSSEHFARTIGYLQLPVDDLVVFHIIFGKTVPDISLNAVANLGYAEGVFHAPVFVGDTLSTTSEVIGLKQTSAGDSGIVYVRSTGRNQRNETVLSYVRWVLVRKRLAGTPAAQEHVPQLRSALPVSDLGQACARLTPASYDAELAGSAHAWEDYAAGERIDHVDGMSVEEAEHQIATRLWQNTAKVHFDGHAAKDTRFGKRLIYGGHVISLARALSFNGLANAFHIAAINGGRHVAPLFAGDTVYAWSEVLESAALSERDDVGAVRLRLVATKNRPCADFPLKTADGYAEGVILDLDIWALMPRKVSAVPSS